MAKILKKYWMKYLKKAFKDKKKLKTIERKRYYSLISN